MVVVWVVVLGMGGLVVGVEVVVEEGVEERRRQREQEDVGGTRWHEGGEHERRRRGQLAWCRASGSAFEGSVGGRRVRVRG